MGFGSAQFLVVAVVSLVFFSCYPGGDMYVYCLNPVHGYYYNTRTQKCRHTNEDMNYTCPYSGRLYRTFDDCDKECLNIFTKNSRKCSTAPLPQFSRCRATDMKDGAWWFFSSDANKCAEWDFPDGSCPQLTREQYRSEEACKRSCSGPNAAQKDSCRWPDREACYETLLKYSTAMAYFNNASTCFLSYVENLRRIRCHLDRPTFFDTEKECRMNCTGIAKNLASRRT